MKGKKKHKVKKRPKRKKKKEEKEEKGEKLRRGCTIRQERIKSKAITITSRKDTGIVIRKGISTKRHTRLNNQLKLKMRDVLRKLLC